MAVETGKQSIEQIKNLEQFLPKKSKEDIAQILAYGEKMKAEGEKKKEDFWKKHNRDDFLNLLSYKIQYKKETEGKYKYLNKMDDVEKEMFIKEYLYDNILYSGKFNKSYRVSFNNYSYEDLLHGLLNLHVGDSFSGCYDDIGIDEVKKIIKSLKVVEGVQLNFSQSKIGINGVKYMVDNLILKEGVALDLYTNKLGDKGAEIISHMKLKEGVAINLYNNNIGDKGAKAIAENMKLKEGVTLELYGNEIGNDGAEALSLIILKEGVDLNLWNNRIGDYGINSIIQNLELKEGVTLHLSDNPFSNEMKQKLKEWEKSYHDKGINCKVLVG